MKSLALALAVLPALALAQQPMPPEPPMPPPPPGAVMGLGMLPGIPPHVAQRLGIPPETVKKVRDLAFDANEQLIGVEADLKRAQLDFERYLAGATVDEAQALSKLEAVNRAELAVKKNRVSLMVRIRKLLGSDTWQKVEAEMPLPPDAMRGGPFQQQQMQRTVTKTCDSSGNCMRRDCVNGGCLETSTGPK